MCKELQGLPQGHNQRELETELEPMCPNPFSASDAAHVGTLYFYPQI